MSIRRTYNKPLLAGRAGELASESGARGTFLYCYTVSGHFCCVYIESVIVIIKKLD